MNKLIRIIAAIAVSAMLFTGCSENQTIENNIPSTETVSEFELIEIPIQTPRFNDKHCRIYKDPVTNIVYMEFRGFTSGGLVWMPDPNTGLPLKYEHFLELYKEYIPIEELQGENANE